MMIKAPVFNFMHAHHTYMMIKAPVFNFMHAHHTYMMIKAPVFNFMHAHHMMIKAPVFNFMHAHHMMIKAPVFNVMHAHPGSEVASQARFNLRICCGLVDTNRDAEDTCIIISGFPEALMIECITFPDSTVIKLPMLLMWY